MLITLLIVAVVIFDSIQGNPVHYITSPVSIVFDPAQKLVQGIGGKVNDFFSAISEGIEIRQENRDLQKQVAELQYQVQQGEEATRRWTELKDAFHIKDTFENYEIHGSSILTREADEWFSVIRIDTGSNDGIAISDKNPSYAVVDAQMNLVGRVQSTDFSTSKVLPILHEGFTVSAKVNTVNGAVVRVHGAAELKADGLCRVDQISSQAKLQVGDELVTSGKGGLFPAGIPIGIIISVDDSSDLNRSATLKPYVDIASLNDVFVMAPNSEAAAQTDSTEASQ